MLKILLLIAVIYAVYYFFFKKKTSVISKNSNNNSQKLQDNDMVPCSTCGTYTEVNEAILSNGKFYCSKECLKDAK